MNFKNLLFVFLILSGITLHAQEGVKIGFRFSPIVSFSNISDNDGNSIDGLDGNARLGFSYGLMFNYGFTENYAFHTGVHIVNKRFKRTQTVDNTEAIQEIRVTAVELPIGLKLRSKEISDGFTIHGLFGIAVEINTAYKNEFSGLDPRDSFTPASGSTRDNDLIKPVTLGFLFGPGAEYDLGVGTLNFGLIYHQGLTNITNLSSYGQDENIKLHYLSFELGYYF